jgi:choline dehydrogenase-like flavoprotein
MITDLRMMPDRADIAADVCVIGSGPAGIALAREFHNTANRVVLVESGGLGYERAPQSLAEGESIGLEHRGLTEGRRRQFGGAANIWGGYCVELNEFDFLPRSWVRHSGWPTSKSEIRAYYQRARTMLRIDDQEAGEEAWSAMGMRAAPFRRDLLHLAIARSTPILDLGRAFRADIRESRNVSLLLHATATALHTNAYGTAIERVRVQTLEGKEACVRARTVVLCCGGIENPRLLLLSRDVHAAGLGNRYDLVGRFFADHTFTITARITVERGMRPQDVFRSLRRRRMNLSPKLFLSTEVQKRQSVLNCCAEVLFEYGEGSAFHAVERLRMAIRMRRLPATIWRDLWYIARDPAELPGLAFDRYVRGRHPGENATELRLRCIAEQVPDRDSRVTLSERRDALGLQLASLEWRASDTERRTLDVMTGAVAREFERLEIGTVLPEPWLKDGDTGWRENLVEGYHHTGTTRMGDHPRSSVVDRSAQVHGVAGLFVAGSSIFPTAGSVSPTLTIVALAIRLADHLKTVDLQKRP